MCVPYLKDVLVSLYEDVVVSMKGMSSSVGQNEVMHRNEHSFMDT
jgi:hypothetical protein